MLTLREKSLLPEKKFSPEEYRTHDAASGRTASPTHYQPAIPAPRCIKQNSEPNTLPTSYSGPTPHQAEQRAQHTTNKLFRPHAASSRTASPTHYQPAIPAPRCIKQNSEPNTLPTSYSGPTPHQAEQRAQHTTNKLFRPPGKNVNIGHCFNIRHCEWSYPANSLIPAMLISTMDIYLFKLLSVTLTLA